MQVWPLHPGDVGLEGLTVEAGCTFQTGVDLCASRCLLEHDVSSQNLIALDQLDRRLAANLALQKEMADEICAEVEEPGFLEVAIVAVVDTPSAQHERTHSVLTTKLWLHRHGERDLASFANEAAELPRSEAIQTHSRMHAAWVAARLPPRG